MRLAALFLLMAVAPLCGCADIAFPRLLHPGSEQYQQSRAEVFDPYPLPDVGPTIVGGRPLQYITPAPWNERVQNSLSYEERYHQAPPPGLYRPQRTNTARQGVIYSPTQPAVVPLGVAPLPSAPAVVPLPQGTAPPFNP
jgi:hypothetical protein